MYNFSRLLAKFTEVSNSNGLP
ncbi:hypothetical protein JI435_409500 [Parastagonospora nodorum SN15]|uniref:Uncharacterized protein n=1 Tax=Phaeosphaeria nodorum (strain SN15 / ATCC MYA-4574 / FGSC 10173) TaxID=321614 RepID=A0A7U2F121_PHANO|nr:hypothetical protein JI435_409500 [Parastagonospora nodorum SN15]